MSNTALARVLPIVAPESAREGACAPMRTRKQSAGFLSASGYPITERYFEKLCCAGQGPQPDYEFGGRYLYSTAVLLDWARARSKPARSAAA
jgi:hypothetical protein